MAASEASPAPPGDPPVTANVLTVSSTYVESSPMLPSQKTRRPSARTTGPSGNPRSEASKRASIRGILLNGCPARPTIGAPARPEGASMAPGNDPTSAAGPSPEDESPAAGLTRRRLLQSAAAAGIVVGSSGLVG